ncbi:hypothetical protein B0H19DRAFT_1012968 [Mycena capillaripes]|nr:hypothetical protein B0H19DRAFT_1012968 [Mycena capillaripes]
MVLLLRKVPRRHLCACLHRTFLSSESYVHLSGSSLSFLATGRAVDLRALFVQLRLDPSLTVSSPVPCNLSLLSIRTYWVDMDIVDIEMGFFICRNFYEKEKCFSLFRISSTFHNTVHSTRIRLSAVHIVRLPEPYLNRPVLTVVARILARRRGHIPSNCRLMVRLSAMTRRD